jgi:hypothetical protein
MELEELRGAWMTLNTRVSELEAAQRKAALTEAQRTSRRLMREPIFELVCALLSTLWAGSVLGSNWAKVLAAPGGALPALIVLIWSVSTVVLSIWQLNSISLLDYSGPVVETQRRIAALRSLRVRSTQFWMLAGLPLWLVFPLFALQSLGAYEIVQRLDAGWMIGNVVVGIVMAAGLVFAARRMGAHSRFWQKVNDTLAGTDIVRAQAMLAQVERFERGE